MTFPDHLIAGQVPPCRVWLDDVEQFLCVEVCVSEGWAIVCKTGGDGLMIVEGDEIATEKRHGTVRLAWAEGWTERGQAWLAAGCPPLKEWDMA